jgi:hypothetical protein
MLTRYTIQQLRNVDVWIGAVFEATSPHLLILAESTYGPHVLLSAYVLDWIAGRVRDATFTAIYNACTASRAAGYSGVSKRTFWDSIAFYNFVPGSIGPASTAHPTASAFKSGVRPLHLILDVLRPDGVLIFGLGHSDYSRPVIQAYGTPYVVVPHTRSGVPAAFITQSWDILIRIAA